MGLPMHTHKLVRDGDVVRVYTDGKPTMMAFNTDKIFDIRMFVQGGGLSEGDVDKKMAELFSPTGETEIQDLK
jgi:hypothetical protein